MSEEIVIRLKKNDVIDLVFYLQQRIPMKDYVEDDLICAFREALCEASHSW